MKMKGTILLMFLAMSLAAPLHAHRLEGLLQASLVEVLPTEVGVEVTLTPGVDVAPAVMGLIDANGDGGFSEEETKEWSALFLSQQSVMVDGKSLPLKLDGNSASPAVLAKLANISTRAFVMDNHRGTFAAGNLNWYDFGGELPRLLRRNRFLV